MRGRVKLVQVAPASRADLEQYRAIAAEVATTVEEINHEFGTQDWQPVEYVTEQQDLRSLVALFGIADVGMIAPLRDGQNLVAHEFVASQDGRRDAPVLVLSQNAGAAQVLPSAVHVDPYSQESLVRGLEHAFAMDPHERSERIANALDAVSDNSVHRWQNAFLGELERKTARSGDVRVSTNKSSRWAPTDARGGSPN
jgi:trehalose 6-phosphate synthase